MSATPIEVICGPKSTLHGLLTTCRRIAPSDSTVLLGGETGTGKEVFARYVHQHSRRAEKAFVPVNCGAIPEALLESELFGHVRGAFTGAATNRRGRVALAEGGTLFLDEIGELSLPLQVKLLRLLQQRTYEPVGSAESISANFRLVAATNKNLAEEVEAGRFRRDLYYRLMVCPVTLPPLRARPGDVRVLFNHFWKQRGERRSVHEDVMASLELHTWPGNVRELENLVERISVCVEAPAVTLASLPADVRALLGGQVDDASELAFAFASEGLVEQPLDSAPVELAPEGTMLSSSPPSPPSPPVFAAPAQPLAIVPPPPSPPAPSASSLSGVETSPPRPSAPHLVSLDAPIDLPALLKQLEDSYIDAALEKTGGNRKSAADMLGLQRTTLVEKLRRRGRDVGANAPALVSA